MYREQSQLDQQTEYVKGVQDSYSWMDASIRQRLFDNRIELVLGSRNLFDVKTIRNTTQGANGHALANSRMMLGYGRSYFIKFLYNLKYN